MPPTAEVAEGEGYEDEENEPADLRENLIVKGEEVDSEYPLGVLVTGEGAERKLVWLRARTAGHRRLSGQVLEPSSCETNHRARAGAEGFGCTCQGRKCRGPGSSAGVRLKDLFGDPHS